VAVFSLRLDDDLAARFDAAARAHGGRSARLRQLIVGACAACAPSASPGRRDALRLMVRLAAPEAAHVASEAAAMALPRAGWVAALVRAHGAGRPRFSQAGDLALLGIRVELRRIGVNVNQIARALNTAVLEGRLLDTELTAVEALRRELRAHIEAIGEAFEGNLAYWAAGDGG
jgi:hypothetical protein